MADDKYVVFKREDFDSILRKFAAGRGDLAVLGEAWLTDAHVIREQDIFAPGVLHTYASAVQTAIEVLEQAGSPVPDYLFVARDHFYGAAEAAAQSPIKKLPDA